MGELNRHFEKNPKDVSRSSFVGWLELVFHPPQYFIRHCKSFPSGKFEPEHLKAGVNTNLSEILGSLKTDWKGRKSLWNTTRQLPDPTMVPQVGGQLFGLHLPICNFKF